MTRFQRWMAICASLGMLLGPVTHGMADDPAGGSARGAANAAAAAKLNLAFIPAQAVAAIIGHPQGVLTGPSAEWMPVEVITAAGLKEGGFDPVKLQEVVVLFASPKAAGPSPEIGVVMRFSEPYSKQQITAAMKGRETTLAGHSVITVPGPQPFLWNFADEKTLVGGTEGLLKEMLTVKDADSPLIGLLKKVDTSAHLTAVFSIDAVRSLMKQAIAAAPPAPPPFQDFLKLPDLLSAIMLRVNAGDKLTATMTLRGVDEAAGQEVERIVNQGLAMARMMIMEQVASGPARSSDPVEQATAKYASRISNKIFDEIKPVRRGQNVTISFESNSSVATLGILAGLLLPAVQSARSAARRLQSMNNLRQISIALLSFEAANRHFPARAIFSKEGKPLLSWRVAILPFIEQNNLFNQFHLDEPWNSEHNKSLLVNAPMPQVFQDPRRALGNTTNYLAVVGKGLAFDGDKGLTLAQFTDGTSNTIMVVQANDDRAVPWTKPDDLEVDLKKPLDGLGEAEANGFSAAFADGHVMLIPKTVKEETLRRLFGRADGLVVDQDDLNQ